jgi:hypothetical protein
MWRPRRRDGIDAMSAEGVATGQSPEAEPATSDDTVSDDGIAHIVGARRLKPTGSRKQR